MRVELHCHSTCSDGSEPPERVAQRARRAGVTLFCLTDHDTCAGYPATRSAGMRALRGVELSCVEDGRTVHLLVYDVTGDDRWRAIEHALEAQHGARRDRVYAMASRLRALGVRIDADAIIASAGSGVVGRPHVARAVVAAGGARSVDEAFDRFLRDGGPADVLVARLGVAQALALGRSAGAAVALAHPHTLGAAAEALVSRYHRQGLGGIEAFYGRYSSRQRRRWLKVARAHGLVVTAGSDYHGASTPKVAEPGVDLPPRLGRELLDWLGVRPD